ncbi:MAG: glycoside hydrolase family 3 N-terminal domain-containing protein [Chloroflexota bacterium]
MSTYKNSSLPIAERVDDLISQMTLGEKILQMVYGAPAIERLGVPEYNWWNEGLHGVGRAGIATVFPQAIGLAAIWDHELIHTIATAISDEARAKHHEALRHDVHSIYTGLTYWSPNINIFRDPRWGRGQETFGEDPYLTASLGVAFVRGLQGDDPGYLKLVATPKHFAAHSGPESIRHSYDVRVSEQDLRETYLPHFEACIREGGAYSVMGAYTRLNGEACCASPTLLQKLLRDEWGFDGYVVSDCWAIIDIYASHKIVDTPEEAAALAVQNGCDLNCGSTYPYLFGAVAQNLISEEVLDQSLKRLFTARFKLGMFDPPEEVPYAQIPYEIVNCKDHQELALQAARKSIVLLKNEEDLLPLSKDIASIAVIGPNADYVESLLGNYHGTPADPTTPLAGIRRKLSPSTKIYYAQGSLVADGVLPLEPVPTTYLYPSNSQAAEHGLNAEYFDNPNFEGVPVRQQLDRNVDAFWKGISPITGKWGDGFSVRWSGYFCPPRDGRCKIGVNGFNAYKLYLDDELIVEFEDTHDHHTMSKDVELVTGRFYKLQLDYASQGIDSRAQLLWAWPDVDYLSPALEAAGKADVVVAVMGLTPLLEREELEVDADGFLGGDRADICLPAPRNSCSNNSMLWANRLFWSCRTAVPWQYSGQKIISRPSSKPGIRGIRGDALADVLFGDYNPAGRLPITLYKSLEDLPPLKITGWPVALIATSTANRSILLGSVSVIQTFTSATCTWTNQKAAAGDSISISVEVTNTGDRAGEEVVQLYTRQYVAPPRPIKELKGFRRISLEPGECKTVTFTLFVNQLAVYDEDLIAAVHPGKVEIMVGNSSEHLPLTGSFEIMGQTTGIQDNKVFFSQVHVK